MVDAVIAVASRFSIQTTTTCKIVDDGEDDGLGVGRAVGSAVGSAVGRTVGRGVAGPAVGPAVGRAVGRMVGRAVGRAVAAPAAWLLLGPAVGPPVTRPVGLAVGRALDGTTESAGLVDGVVAPQAARTMAIATVVVARPMPTRVPPLPQADTGRSPPRGRRSARYSPMTIRCTLRSRSRTPSKSAK